LLLLQAPEEALARALHWRLQKRAARLLANNAGIVSFGTADTLEEKDWDMVIDINLKGVFFGTKYAVKQLLKQGRGGRIINISSIAGLVGFPGISAYCASKGGVTEFTREAALDYAGKGITVNAINPVGRFGKPEDIGNAAVFLASDESSFITGHNLVVDGGWTAQ